MTAQRVMGSAFTALQLVAIFSAGNLACSGPRHDPTLVRDELDPGERATLDPMSPGAAIVCDVSNTPAGVEPEIYMLSAINHKLQTYPELASAVGASVVSDCEGARAYTRTYRDYAIAHPDFDAAEPLAPMAADTTQPPPPTADAAPETSKIFNGGPAKNNPIVHIQYNFTSDPVDPSFNYLRGAITHCSGTFIGKNWILTAAHCVTAGAVDDCMRRGKTRTNCDPRWDYWGLWLIEGTKGFDQQPWATQAVARGYIHPNWPGRFWENNPTFCPPPSGSGGAGGAAGGGAAGGGAAGGGAGGMGGAGGSGSCYDRPGGAETDLAILYVPDDTKLPGWVEEDGAARLSIVTPSPVSWQMSIWGWGQAAPRMPGDPPLAPTLRTNNFNHPIPNLTVGRTITGLIPTTDRAFPCSGDSGGPLMRDGVQINTNLGADSVQAIVGVLSYGDPSCDFPTTRGGWAWARVDPMTDVDSQKKNYNFIRETLGRWPSNNGPFQCTGRKLVAGTPPAEIGNPTMDECWGTSCSGDTCGQGKYCSHSGREYAAYHANKCETCGGNDCTCIIGQCLPAKK